MRELASAHDMPSPGMPGAPRIPERCSPTHLVRVRVRVRTLTLTLTLTPTLTLTLTLTQIRPSVYTCGHVLRW